WPNLQPNCRKALTSKSKANYAIARIRKKSLSGSIYSLWCCRCLLRATVHGRSAICEPASQPWNLPDVGTYRPIRKGDVPTIGRDVPVPHDCRGPSGFRQLPTFSTLGTQFPEQKLAILNCSGHATAASAQRAPKFALHRLVNQKGFCVPALHREAHYVPSVL